MKNENLDTVNKEILNKGFFLIGLFINIGYYVFIILTIIFIVLFVFDLGIFLGLYHGDFIYSDAVDGEKINIIKNSFFTVELGFFGHYLYYFFLCGFGIITFYVLKGLISSFRKGEVFTEKNLKKMKILSYISVLFVILGIFMFPLEEWFRTDVIHFVYFLIFFKIYVVGYEIHREKLKLEEENNLTI